MKHPGSLQVLVLTVLSLLVTSPVVAQDGATAIEESSNAAWTIDRSHSGISFTVRHFFTPVNGVFEDYDLDFVLDPEDLEGSRINVTIPVASVNTHHTRRDADLRSASFFEVETYPNATFTSSHIESTGENEFVAHGTLTIRDVTADLSLPFTLLGVMDLTPQQTERTGRTKRAGFSAEVTLDRTAFGVGSGNWASTAVVGADVKVSSAISATR